MKVAVACFVALQLGFAGVLPAIAACCSPAPRSARCCAKKDAAGHAEVQKSPCCHAAPSAPERREPATVARDVPDAVLPRDAALGVAALAFADAAFVPRSPIVSRKPRSPLPLRV